MARDVDPNLLSVVLDSWQAVSPFIQNILSRYEGSADMLSMRTVRKRSHSELYELPNTMTEYGTVVEEIVVDGEDGPLKVWAINHLVS